jgi:hypothetical protein
LEKIVFKKIKREISSESVVQVMLYKTWKQSIYSRSNYSLIKEDTHNPFPKDSNESLNTNSFSTSFFLKEINGVVCLIEFMNLNETYSTLIDQYVIQLFQIIGDSLGGIQSKLIQQNLTNVLRVSLTR